MRLTGGFLVLMVLFCGSPVGAYQLLDYRWSQPTTSFFVNIPTGEGVWNAPFETAMDHWGVSIFKFKINRGVYEDPCNPPDGRNGVGFDSTFCGEEWGSTALAVTQLWISGSTFYQSDIVFNSNQRWNVYSTPWQYGVSDFQRIAVHELGHVIGLDHEESEIITIMKPYAGDVTVPQADDIAGVAAIYGTPPPLTCSYTLSPTSSSFTAIGGTGNITVTATDGCPWVAKSSASWITVSSGGSGTGNGTVNYSVAANSGVLLSGTIAIAGQTFLITSESQTPAKTEGSGGGGCFIATAAFGSPMERHVQILRDFRDRYLLNYKLGNLFVNCYYQASPPIAEAISKSETLKLLTRWFLMPVIGAAYLMVIFGIMTTLLIITLILLLLILSVSALRKTTLFSKHYCFRHKM
jgi:hypothetical protein